MGIRNFLIVLTIILVPYVAYQTYLVLQPPPTIKNLPEPWWTNTDPKMVNPAIRPFKIDVPEPILEDLKARLNMAQQHTLPLENTNFTYGFNTEYLHKLLPFWKNQYDWRSREKFLNQYPQFLVNVQGLDIHFIEVKPQQQKNVRTVPLLLLHGWPGSVREFYRMIPMLTTPRDGIQFHLIIPSLPGYGFSQGATKPGLGATQITTVMKNLMLKIGFKKWVVQGGDWGSIISQTMAVIYPQHLIGMHSNLCSYMSAKTVALTFLGSYYPSLVVEPEYAHLMYPQSDKLKYLIEESGYFHLQASKPDTVGVALRESPIGLAVYIMEKFSTWTDPSYRNLPDGGLTQKFTLTELLDNVMIYWVTGSITTSVRIYAETFSIASRSLRIDEMVTEVPAGCIHFPNDLVYSPDYFLKMKFLNYVHSSHPAHGGHFPAMEVPDVLATDIFKFVAKLKF